MEPPPIFQQTAHETQKTTNLVVCAALDCRLPSTELQHMGTVCKHAYCWACVIKLEKVRDPMCKICLSPLEPARPTPATFMNNLTAGLQKWATLLEEVELVARRDRATFTIDVSTQKMILESKEPQGRTIEEFMATQNIVSASSAEETSPAPSPKKSRTPGRIKREATPAASARNSRPLSRIQRETTPAPSPRKSCPPNRIHRSATKTPRSNRSRTISGCSSISIELDDFEDQKKPAVKTEVLDDTPDSALLVNDVKQEPPDFVGMKPVLPMKPKLPEGGKAAAFKPMLFMTQEVGKEEPMDTTPARPVFQYSKASTKRSYEFTKVPTSVFNRKENVFPASPELPSTSKQKYAKVDPFDSPEKETPRKETPKREKKSFLPKKSLDFITPARTNDNEVDLNIMTLERGAPRKSLIHRTGERPVVTAVLEGDVEKLRRLCAEDVEVNEIDPEYGTPLFLAAKMGNLEMCAILVEAGAVINAHCGSECNTALHVAVQNEYEKVAEYLMSKGASRQLRNIRNLTPAEMAQSMSPIRKLVEKYRKYPRQLHIPPKLPKRIVMCIDEEARKLLPSGVLDRVRRYFEVELELTSESTHCVVPVNEEGTADGCNQTLITAMLRGLKVVRVRYIEDCIRAGEAIADWLPYEVGRIRFREYAIAEGSVMRCRRAKERFEPGLFKGCIFHLYSTKFSTYGKRTFLGNLIHLAEGEVVNKEPAINPEDPKPFHKPTLSSPYFILYEQGTKIPSRILDEPMYHMVSPGWLFECITSYEFKSPY